jgi:hypothetical protein
MFQDAGGIPQHDEEDEQVEVGAKAREGSAEVNQQLENLKAGEVAREQYEIDSICKVALGEAVTEEERAAARKEFLDELKRAKDSEGRVAVFAALADCCGVEALVGLIFPEIGDLGAAAVELAYLLSEAKLARTGMKSKLKILAYTGIDLAIGLIPVVGDAADFAYMSNMKALDEFEKNTKEKAAAALEAGCSQEEVQEILESGQRLRKAIASAEKFGKMVGAVGKKAA